MPKSDHIEFRGKIIDTLGGGQYSIELDTESKLIIRARLNGKMKQNRIRVIIGDKVTVAVSPYDSTHGMITFRDRT